MARIPMDAFEEGTEIVRVYLAASLGEAQRVESVLEEAGLEFAVEVEEFASRAALFSGGVRRGAGFWVRETVLDGAAAALERAGWVAGLVDRG
jgi:hypothetical protein